MSDYTPTTEEIRESYVLMQKCGAYPKPDAEFDRWLIGVKKKERDRAIKIFNRKTFHYGKTHSAKTECHICSAFLEIDGNNND